MAITITTNTPLPEGFITQAYTQTIDATGGTTYSWSVPFGTLPAGVALDPITGILSGTPTVPGTYVFTIRATEGTNTGGGAAAPSSLGSINNGPWGVGQEMNILVYFGVNITVTGTPSLTLDINGTPKNATYKSGSGGRTIVFSYIIESGVNAAAGQFSIVSPLQMNGGSMKDGSSADITTAFTPPSTSSLVVDTIPPNILGVSVVGSGPWVTGSNLDFDVHTSKNVYVSTTNGAPHINFTLDSTPKVATYISGSESAHIIFRYVVQDGDYANGTVAVDSPLALY